MKRKYLVDGVAVPKWQYEAKRIFFEHRGAKFEIVDTPVWRRQREHR